MHTFGCIIKSLIQSKILRIIMYFKVDTYTFDLLIFTTLKYSIPMIHDPQNGQKHRRC